NRVTLSATWSQQDMSERPVVALYRRSEISPHDSCDFLSIRTMHNWKVGAQALRPVYVILPAKPGDHVSLPHEEAVAVFPCATIHHSDDSLSAAIRYPEKHCAIRAIHVLRLQEIQIRREFNFTLCIAIGFVEIGDLLVVSVVRPHLEVNTSFNLFIRTGQSVRLPVCNITARCY